MTDVAASICGSPMGEAGGQYARVIDPANVDVDEALNDCRDQLITVDPAVYNRKWMPDKARKEFFSNVIQRLASGHVRGGDGIERRRCVAMLSADSSARDLIGTDFGEGGQFDGAFRLPIPVLFKTMPSGSKGPGDLEAQIRSVIHVQHGTAIAVMLEYVVNLAARNPEALAAEVERLRESFRRHVGASADGDLARRVADAFSLFYSGGEIAKRAGAVPSTFRTLAPVSEYYRLCLEAMKPPRSGRERLIELAKSEGVIDLRSQPKRKMDDAELAAVPAFLDLTPAKELLLLVTSEGMPRAIPDWRFVLKEADVTAMLWRDKQHDKAKHRVRKNERDRVYRFVLGPVDTIALTPPVEEAPIPVDTAGTGAISEAKPKKRRRVRDQATSSAPARKSKKVEASTRSARREQAEPVRKGRLAAVLHKPGKAGGCTPKGFGIAPLRIGMAVRATYPETNKRYRGVIEKLSANKALIGWSDGDKARWVMFREVEPHHKRRPKGRDAA